MENIFGFFLQKVDNFVMQKGSKNIHIMRLLKWYDDRTCDEMGDPILWSQ